MCVILIQVARWGQRSDHWHQPAKVDLEKFCNYRYWSSCEMRTMKAACVNNSLKKFCYEGKQRNWAVAGGEEDVGLREAFSKMAKYLSNDDNHPVVETDRCRKARSLRMWRYKKTLEQRLHFSGFHIFQLHCGFQNPLRSTKLLGSSFIPDGLYRQWTPNWAPLRILRSWILLMGQSSFQASL